MFTWIKPNFLSKRIFFESDFFEPAVFNIDRPEYFFNPQISLHRITSTFVYRIHSLFQICCIKITFLDDFVLYGREAIRHLNLKNLPNVSPKFARTKKRLNDIGQQRGHIAYLEKFFIYGQMSGLQFSIRFFLSKLGKLYNCVY